MAAASHAYTFPPFPTPPPGVQITPFADFRENGIQVFSPDGKVEVDGLGIPTVELGSKHDSDEGKTEARPKKSITSIQPRTIVNSDGTKSKRLPDWYEAWAETESSRICSYDQKLHRTDRVHAASKDFDKNRPWPPISSGVRAQWDQIRLFIGIIVNTPIWKRVNKDQDNADDGDDGDDDDLDEEEEGSSKANINMTQSPEQQRPKNPYKRPRPRPPYANYGKTPVEVETDEQVQELIDKATNERRDKLEEFLNDPARAAQVYMSSYMRRQGLHYSHANLITIPKLWRFYIDYLLRCRALSEPEYEKGFRNALQYIELAAEELPKTSEIAKAIPDGLCNAFQECFEIKRREHKMMIDQLDLNSSDDPAPPKTFELTTDGDLETAEEMEQAFDESVEAGNIKIVNSDLGLATSRSATITEVVDEDPDGVRDATSANASEDQNKDGETAGWGTGVAEDDSWGNVDANANGWGENENTKPAGEDPWNTSSALDWAMPEPDSLMKFLGPTVFPLTHTSGVMEWSVRKIKSIIPPPSQVKKCPVLEDGEEPDGEAVEVELERQFPKVVLEPWIGWESPQEEPEKHKPCIQTLSRGKVVVNDGIVFEGQHSEDSVAPEDAEKVEAELGIKVHDALQDNIAIFLEKATAEKLKVGMGLGGLWVQLARVSDFEPEGGKSKGKKASPRYWFLERTTATLTSYHVVDKAFGST
ncbi:hypothetical protein VKT23_001523 [Stygiomarasmius scandens]|uniref:Uncharacterized protein n=1 Tax=Marasmiellus scandens TaxID=2682957 RepID=A0ABR1K0H6_9AGAR